MRSLIVFLAGLAAAHASANPSPQDMKICAQDIVDVCVAQFDRQFKNCPATDWICMCETTTNKLTCYNNCMGSNERPPVQNQVLQFCNAAAPLRSASIEAAASTRSQQDLAVASAASSAASAVGSAAASATSAIGSAIGSAISSAVQSRSMAGSRTSTGSHGSVSETTGAAAGSETGSAAVGLGEQLGLSAGAVAALLVGVGGLL